MMPLSRFLPAVIGIACLAGCSSLQQASAPNDSVSRNLNEMRAKLEPKPDERLARIAGLEQQLEARDTELSSLRPKAGELVSANRQLGDFQTQLASRDQELSKLHNVSSELDGANRRIADLERTIADRDRDMAQLRQSAGDLDSAKQRISDLEGRLGERERELASLRLGAGELTAANRKLSDLDQQLADRDAELARLRQATSDRDRLTTLMTASANDLEDTKRRLAEQTKRLEDRTAKLSERDQEVARLNGLLEKGQGTGDELARTHQQVASLTGTLSDRDQEILRLRNQLDQRRAEKDLVKALQPEITAGHVNVNQAGDKLTINLASAVLFDSGKDELKPGGVDLIKRVGGILKEFPKQAVHVAGYTDSAPIRGALAKKFPTNKELSDARAQHAATLLEENGVTKSNLTAAGHGDSHPVADNKTNDGRSKNRRVEIVVSAK